MAGELSSDGHGATPAPAAPQAGVFPAPQPTRPGALPAGVGVCAGAPSTNGPQRRLAAPQLAILSAEVWSPEPAAYTVVSAVRVDGVPRWEHLATAAHATLSRHDVLTWQPGIDADGNLTVSGGPTAAAFTIEQIDLTGLTGKDADAAIHARLHQERHRTIRVLNQADQPFTRMILFRVGRAPGSDSGVCALATHHVFIDEYSTDLIWNELFRRAAGRDVSEEYDLRYAAWAHCSLAPSAQAAARCAAAELAAQLRGTALDITAAAPRAATAAGSPLRFTIPPTLTNAAAARARTAQVPLSALYGAAFGQLLCAHADTSGLAVSVPVTRRTGIADIGTVGCYVSALPVPVRAARDPATAIRQWHRALDFTAAHAHADTTAVRSEIGGTAQVSLSFEARGGRRTAKPITWRPLAPPDSPAKSPLACFLSPGTRDSAGDGRLLWRRGTLDTASAAALADMFLTTLARFTAGHDAPPTPEMR